MEQIGDNFNSFLTRFYLFFVRLESWTKNLRFLPKVSVNYTDKKKRTKCYKKKYAFARRLVDNCSKNKSADLEENSAKKLGLSCTMGQKKTVEMRIGIY